MRSKSLYRDNKEQLIAHINNYINEDTGLALAANRVQCRKMFPGQRDVCDAGDSNDYEESFHVACKYLLINTACIGFHNHLLMYDTSSYIYTAQLKINLFL